MLNTEDIFTALSKGERVALAVSGGGDSMALLHLFAEWRRAHPLPSPQSDMVLTVDHGLRPDSEREAAYVVKAAAQLGFEAAALRIKGLSDESNIQAAARSARYQRMADWMIERGIAKLLTAHTLDDQAETFMMRLMRGSGVEGLRAMLPERVLFDILLCRPLLGVSRAALRSFLLERGVEWVQDPGNENEDFERVVWRRQLAALDDAEGLSTGIHTSARRLASAYEALRQWSDCFLSVSSTTPLPGVMLIDASAYELLPVAVRVMVWQQVLAKSGRESTGLKALETAEAKLAAMQQGRFAVSGLMISKLARGCGYLAYREAARAPLEEFRLKLQGGAKKKVTFDGRVRLEIEAFEDVSLVISGPSQAEAEVMTRALSSSLKQEVASSGAASCAFSGDDFFAKVAHGDLTTILMGFAGIYAVDEASSRRGGLLALPQLDRPLEQLALKALADEGSGEYERQADCQTLGGLFRARLDC